MATATDSEVITFARESGAVVVTLDADFHALLVRFGATHPSVIRLRAQGFSAEEFTALIDRVLVRCREEIETGAMVSSDGRRIRVRKLPLLR
jgi:predicted nuclease of predicted toxin-antitoxin system